MRNLIYASNEERRVRKETVMACGFAEQLTSRTSIGIQSAMKGLSNLRKMYLVLEGSSGIMSRRPNMEKQE